MSNSTTKRYRSSLFKLAGNLFSMIFLAAFLGAMLVFGLAKLFDIDYNAMFVVVPLAIAGAIAYTILWKYCWVEVYDDRVVVSSLRKKEQHTFSRHECAFSSNVVTHYTNGIPTEKKRYLVVVQGERERQVHLPSISKKEFDALLAALRFSPADIEQLVQEVEVEKSVFAIPREQLVARYFRNVKVYAIAMGIFCALMIFGALYFMISVGAHTQQDMNLTDTFVWTIVFALLLFFGFGVPIYITYRKTAGKIPANVTIDQTTLVVDNERYNFSLIDKITMTPPSYMNDGLSGGTRSVVIYSRGKKTTYIFGDRKPAGKGAFADYGDMCRAIELAALVNKTPCLFDL